MIDYKNLQRFPIPVSPYTLTLIFMIIGAGFTACTAEKKAPVSSVSPGEPKFWDVGSQLHKHPLPKDVDDAYLEFKCAPTMSFGTILAHQKISPRHHESHDLVIYVHNGAARMHIGDKDYFVSIGDMVYIPRGAVYSAESVREGDQLQLLVVYSPSFDGNDVVYQKTEGGAK